MDQEKETNQLIENIDLITRRSYHSKFSDTFQKAICRPAQAVATYLGITSERQSGKNSHHFTFVLIEQIKVYSFIPSYLIFF